MLFQAASDNTQKVRISFQAFRPDPAGGDPIPARLDTVNQPIVMLVDVGTATANVLAEEVGENGFPVYNVEVVSSDLETELSSGRITADGKPGSGLSNIEDTWTYEVSPAAAVNLAAVTVHPAEPK